MSWQQRIDRALDERRAAEAFRRRLPVTHGAGRWLEREGERWLNFSSNDYSGLPASTRRSYRRLAAGRGHSLRRRCKVVAPGHVSGYHEAHQALEEELNDWLGYLRAPLLFISGFASESGAVIAALMDKDDRIIADRLSQCVPASSKRPAPAPAQLRAFLPITMPHQLERQLLGKPLFRAIRLAVI
ncbi:hypothetical protein MJ560_09340 [Klebsiella pneumoniae]|nr:hypothetical protein MJ560_09340 [Klebsiella pneumoniae]